MIPLLFPCASSVYGEATFFRPFFFPQPDGAWLLCYVLVMNQRFQEIDCITRRDLFDVDIDMIEIFAKLHGFFPPRSAVFCPVQPAVKLDTFQRKDSE